MHILKKLALFLTVLLLVGGLVGCSFIIEGTHRDIRLHQMESSPGIDVMDYITVSSLGELEQAIWDMVRTRQESGLFRIDFLHTDGAEKVENAWREISLRPLTAYAVGMHTVRILSEWQGVTEIELTISYQKTAAQIADVRSVSNADSATALLGQMLRDGEPYLAMLCPVIIANVSFLEGTIEAYYYGHPLDVVVLPQTTINLYPSSGGGIQRIAEIVLDFGFDPPALAQMRYALRQAATALVDVMPEDLSPAGQIIWLAESLEAWYAADTDELDALHDTAYGALTRALASNMGIARAFQALLELLDLDAQVVRGELDGAFHVWNLVYLDGYYYHIDISRLTLFGPTYTLFVPDEVMMFQNSYSWDMVLYPRADSPLRYGDF